MKPMNEDDRETLLRPLLQNGWRMADGRDAICKTFKFKNFRHFCHPPEGMAKILEFESFTNRIAAVGHTPVILE